MESHEYVSIKNLAEMLNMDRSHARRYVLNLGIKPQKRRTPDSGNQLSLTVTHNEAMAIVKYRESSGFGKQTGQPSAESGYFYVIQLVPELDPRRVKLGFTIDIKDRLAQHRTAAPTAKVLKTWPCRRSWEQCAIDSLSSISAGCKHIMNEVYECFSFDELFERGDSFFNCLPHPGKRPELSEYSPGISK